MTSEGDPGRSDPDRSPAASDPEGSGLGISDFGITAGVPVRAGEALREPRPHDPRFELAAAVRRITSAAVGADLADADVNQAAASLAEIADRLEKRAGPVRRRRLQPDPVGHPQEFFPTSPVIGFANPVAPPVVVESVDGGLEGMAWFDYQYEGPPGCVHGGVIAMMFDEILGAATIVAGFPGMTGTLTIRYRKPTPLRTPLRVEARSSERQGRKVTTRGVMYHGDVLTAEAEGIFIQLVPERFLKIVQETTDGTDLLEQVRADAVRLGFRAPSSQDPNPQDSPG